MEVADGRLIKPFRFESTIPGKPAKCWQDDIGYKSIIKLSKIGPKSEGCGALDKLKSWVHEIAQVRLCTILGDKGR